jgi:hypothetical protein
MCIGTTYVDGMTVLQNGCQSVFDFMEMVEGKRHVVMDMCTIDNVRKYRVFEMADGDLEYYLLSDAKNVTNTGTGNFVEGLDGVFRNGESSFLNHSVGL